LDVAVVPAPVVGTAPQAILEANMRLVETDVLNLEHVGQLEAWFDEHAEATSAGTAGQCIADALLLLSREGWLGAGVPQALGGQGGSLRDAVLAIAAISERCLTSGFVFWCQRTFAEFLVASGNPWLRAAVLPRVLSGECSGATGLSDAMRQPFPAARLRVQAAVDDGRVTLRGTVPWASNLRPGGFVMAVAARAAPDRAVVVAVPSSAAGLVREPDRQLLGLQGSWTAGVRLEGVELPHEWLLSDDPAAFVSRVRSTVILLQCGLSLGLARRSVAEALGTAAGRGRTLGPSVQAIGAELRQHEATLASLTVRPGADAGRLATVLTLRIALTRLAVRAVHLELEAVGGGAYRDASGTARRVREAAFLPILTPSVVQLEAELNEPPLDGRPEATA
jgi:alkylation response protein AidB-like acyl-CoA dehydrogenase